MQGPRRNHTRAGIAGILGLALVAAPIAMAPAMANTDGTGVVINEVYLNGGSAGATYTHKFAELYNPTDAAIDLSAMSLQYRPSGGVVDPTGVQALSGSIQPGGYYLVKGTANSTNGAALPAEDATMNVSFAGGSGTLFLANQTTALTAPAVGSNVGNPAIVDLIGWGASNTFETTPTTSASVTTSLNRTAGLDTDINSADFTTAAPGPQSSTQPVTPVIPPPPVPEPEPIPTPTTAVPIPEIQGTGPTSPLAGQTVTARGVVTASYATGGLDGYYIQTPGSGAVNAGRTASDAIFVYSPATVASVALGDTVEVTGAVSEFGGMTQVTVVAGAMSKLAADAAPVPAAVAITEDVVQRESLEGMLVAPAGAFTVTDNYDTNFYGAIALVAGDTPLVQPTSVVEPGSPEFTAMLASNAARPIVLDDGSTTNFTTSTNKSIPLPYLSESAPVRIGAAVTFTEPVIFDFRFAAWNFQPTQQLTAANAGTVQPATFENTRTDRPETVGGDLSIATFNVLNYFSTTGDELTGCSYYTDRAGADITVNSGCDARGAANQTSLDRQQAKIVAAINALDADVVALEEIENSAAFGKDRDQALTELTGALNAGTTAGTWDFVRSPAAVPADEDVIRTAFIYKSAVVETVGESVILDDQVAFVNAREPLAQAFQRVGDEDSAFLAIVNHFKSKGSGSGAGDTDAGDGQGASNGSRVRQATALVGFAGDLTASTGIDRVFLAGDFNSYLKEDPIDVLTEAGYVDLGVLSGEQTYAFDGAIGSLDHILASPAASAEVAGVDIWNINSVESIAYEYSRFNYNATNFYAPNAYRSSDHDPIIVGVDFAAAAESTVDLNLLNINDFHGRIDANTVKFAGTIEQLRADYGDANSLFLSDGDNIGASLFASSSQNDQPTIDVLNALELASSGVGNHEFDQGFADLDGRVAAAANWDYLGANVYLAGTTTPAMEEYDIFTIDGVRVAVIGAVTEETPTLVSPDGIAMLDFGNPVEAVNRVVAQLVADDAADVFVAEYHEGAGFGVVEGSTLEAELADTTTAFYDIVTNTSPDVDAIFTGHTHKTYAWDAPIPGAAGETRPILQTGSYGENIGQVVLTVDTTTDDIIAYTARNVPRTTVANAELIAQYPRVALVDGIVTEASASAAVIGNEPIGSITADITTPGGIAAGDRGSESNLSNLIADSLVESLADPALGGAEIGVVNPGGVRSDLLFAKSGAEPIDGIVTYAEANAILPFVNNLWTTTLTGAQFKTVLEQQWQRDAAGNVPSRPFLNLGLSENVNYTFDASLPEGQRITSITIDGAPIDPARGYRIGSFIFLLQGGDNFREFASGTDTRDSGLVDRDAWIGFVSDNSPLSPDFDRRGVSVTGVPTEALAAGDSGTVTVSKLDLTSLGSPVTTRVSASFEGSTAEPVVSTVVGGSSIVGFTVPADVEGDVTLVITAAETGTVARVALDVAPAAAGENPAEPGVETPAGSPAVGNGTGVGNNDNGGSSTGAGNGRGAGSLASTGADLVPGVVGGALMLMIFGAGLLAIRRRTTVG